MVTVDKIMMRELGIAVELMMEQAGEILARFSLIRLNIEQPLAVEGDGSFPAFIVLAGSGNNGGGGLVAARRLKGWGVKVSVVLPRGLMALNPIPREQAERAKKIGVSLIDSLPESVSTDIFVIDAYLGYNYHPRYDPITMEVFEWLRKRKHVISLDVPSGLDVNSGVHDGEFNPEATVTLAFVKKGLLLSNQCHVGELMVADIGVPSWIYASRLGITWTKPFSLESLEQLTNSFSRIDLLKTGRIIDEETGLMGWKGDIA